MKKVNSSNAMLISAAVFSVSIVIAAVLISQTNFTIRQLGVTADGQTAANTIGVSATGEAFLKPDTLTMSVAVSETAKTTKAAIKQANEKINEIREIARANGVQEDDLATSSFNLYPDYDYTNSGSVLVGQNASQTVSIKLRNIGETAEGAAKLIDEIATINNIRVNGLTFSAEDDSEAVTEARAAAMQKAKAKAEELAFEAGVTVFTPVSISESTDSYSPINYYARDLAYATEDSAGSNSTELSTGELMVQVSVSVLYAIE